MSLSRQQITLLGIFALFLAPLLLVMLMRSSWWQYQPAGMKNQGYLLQPPVQLPLDLTHEFGDKWLILYTLDNPCGQKCIDHATALRQIHRATGRKSKHLEVVMLSDTLLESEFRTEIESIYPEFKIVVDTSGAATDVLATVNADMMTDTGDANLPNTYILDPMLNVILAYGMNSNPGDIHADIKRLLKWSEQEN